MKKLLLVMVCLPLTMFGMEKESVVQNTIKFIKMEQQHKMDWLNYKKAMYVAKIDLVENHLNQMIDLKMKGLDKLGKNMDIQTYLKEALPVWIKLHEAQNLEWKELCESWHKKGMDIGVAHKKSWMLSKNLVTSQRISR